jgi:Trp operon repressor
MLKELKITTKTGNHMIVIQDLVSPDFSKQLATRYTILKKRVYTNFPQSNQRMM